MNGDLDSYLIKLALAAEEMGEPGCVLEVGSGVLVTVHAAGSATVAKRAELERGDVKPSHQLFAVPTPKLARATH